MRRAPAWVQRWAADVPVPATSVTLVTPRLPADPPSGATRDGARVMVPAKAGATGLSDSSASASAVHRAAVMVAEKVSPARPTRVLPPAAVPQLADPPAAQAVWTAAGAATPLAATPRPSGMLVAPTLPARDKAGVVAVAEVSSVARRLNCPVSMCRSHTVVLAVASKFRLPRLLLPGKEPGVVVQLPAALWATWGAPPTVTDAEVEVPEKAAGVTGLLQTLRPDAARFCTGTQAAPGVGPDDCTACTVTATGLPPVITPLSGSVISRPPLAELQVQAPAAPSHLCGLLSITGTPVPVTAKLALPAAV
jgi:hypothetical protein